MLLARMLHPDCTIYERQVVQKLINRCGIQASGSTQVKYTRYETAPPCVTPAKDLPGHGSYELVRAVLRRAVNFCPLLDVFICWYNVLCAGLCTCPGICGSVTVFMASGAVTVG